MHIIVLASQKGGSGKTTLSGHLAVEAERSGGGPVVLIDTDPQGSLSQWWNARASQSPAFAKIAIDDLGGALEELRRGGTRLAIIDTPPAITHSISQVISHADLVLIPARPSPHDLRAVGATIDIAEHHGKPLVFVINGATMRARITAEAAVALSQHGTVAPVTLHHRVDFAASMVDGKTIGEIDPKSRSAKEVAELWSYVAGRLARITRSPQPAIAAADLSVRALSPLAPHAPVPADPVAEPPAPQARAETEADLELLDDAEWVSAINDGLPVAFAVEPRHPDATTETTAAATEAAPPPMPARAATSPFPLVYERRGGQERRGDPLGRPPAGTAERRMKVFGRRRADQIPQVPATDPEAPERQR
jgi:chromosome partitioning protein